MTVLTWAGPGKDGLVIIYSNIFLHATLQWVERAFAKSGQGYMEYTVERTLYQTLRWIN